MENYEHYQTSCLLVCMQKEIYTRTFRGEIIFQQCACYTFPVKLEMAAVMLVYFGDRNKPLTTKGLLNNRYLITKSWPFLFANRMSYKVVEIE